MLSIARRLHVMKRKVQIKDDEPTYTHCVQSSIIIQDVHGRRISTKRKTKLFLFQKYSIEKEAV
jgi:hypothetical protein